MEKSNNTKNSVKSSSLHTINNDDISGGGAHSTTGHLDLLNNQEISTDTRVEMTDITLQEDQTVIPTTIGNPTKDMCAYKGDTKILERQFLVSSGTFVGSADVVIEPWINLLGNASLQGYLQRFRYIRAGVKLTIVLDTVPSLYGYIAAVPLYSYLAFGNYELRDLYSAPGLILMDVSSRDSVEIHLPYRMPGDWIDTKEVLTNDYFPRLYIFDGEISTTATTTVPVISYKVYANFEDVTVAGPIAVAQMEYVTAASAGLAAVDAMVTKAAKIANTVYSFMPETPEVVDVPDEDTVVEPLRMTSFGNMSSAAGQSNIPSLTLSKFNPLCGMLTEKAEDLSWKRLLKMQNFHGGNVFNLSQGDTIVLDDRWEYTDGGWFNVVIDSHRFFRGSTKWSLHFFTSPLISTRVQVSVGWFGANGDPGDIYTDIITIQGSSVHTYQVPYIYPKHWRQSRETDEFSYNLNISVISPVTSLGDAVPTVKMLAFHSAADDFIVRGFQSPKRPVAVAQMDITALHSKDFKPILDVGTTIVDEWETNSVYDALKRFSQRLDRNWRLQGTLVARYPEDSYDYWVSYVCRFVRGNLRIKTTLDPGKVYAIAMQPSGSATSGNLIYHAGDGIMLQDSNVWPVAEFEVPYMASYVMVNSCPDWQTSWNGDGLIYADALDDSTFQTFGAIGPNFGLHVLLPPVPRVVRVGLENGA